MIPYEESVTEDGDVVDLLLDGHGLNLDEIELTLLEFCDEREMVADWDITETWVRKVPSHDGMCHVYSNGPGRGAKAVTRVSVVQFWNHWCFNHPYEPAVVGLPAAHPQDLAAAHAAMDRYRTEIDPRVAVREYKAGQPTIYIYLCGDCRLRLEERRRKHRAETPAQTHQRLAHANATPT